MACDLATLSALQKRLRNTTGPDRELDLLIWAECDGRDVRQDFLSYWGREGLLARSRRPPQDECVLGIFHGSTFATVGQNPPAPAPTASVDAALALIAKVLPEANCTGHDATTKGVLGYVSRNYVDSGHWHYEGEHPTSIPIALLRALIAALADADRRAVLQSADTNGDRP